MQNVKPHSSRAHKRAFTLVELLVAMTITVILVGVIMTMTNQGIKIYKEARLQVETTTRAQVALNALSNDFQAMQLGRGENNYQWFFAKADDSAAREIVESSRGSRARKKNVKDTIPVSTQIVFFASTYDRNPAVSSNDELRSNYRSAKALNVDTQGDVNAVGYRLLYRDQILNLAPSEQGGKSRSKKAASETFPLFSLYRQTISPRDAYTDLMGKTNLEAAYRSFEKEEQDNFLCENIFDMNLVLNIDHCEGGADIESGRARVERESVSIINSKGQNEDVIITSRDIIVNGRKLHNAKIVSVNISVTVVTEEGMHIIDQARRGRRQLPDAKNFFREYTRTYSALVAPPSFN